MPGSGQAAGAGGGRGSATAGTRPLTGACASPEQVADVQIAAAGSSGKNRRHRGRPGAGPLVRGGREGQRQPRAASGAAARLPPRGRSALPAGARRLDVSARGGALVLLPHPQEEGADSLLFEPGALLLGLHVLRVSPGGGSPRPRGVFPSGRSHVRVNSYACSPVSSQEGPWLPSHPSKRRKVIAPGFAQQEC